MNDDFDDTVINTPATDALISPDQQRIMVVTRRQSLNAEQQPVSDPIWLITFTDVIALMLTFFVLIYSMTSPEPQKWEHKIGITADGYGDFNSAEGKAGNQEGDNISRGDYSLAEDLQYLEALFNEIIADRAMGDRIVVKGNKGRLNLYLDPSLQLNDPDFVMFLVQLEPVLESLKNQITLNGQAGIKDIFFQLQSLGRIIKDKGYSLPLSLSLYDMNDSEMKSHIIISIESHDGHRIEH